jgi:hypothetical protein
LKLGHVQFAEHQDFWFFPDMELTERSGRFYAGSGPDERVIVSVNGGDAEGFVFRSLSPAGLPVHVLGTLSPAEPEPLTVTTEAGGVASTQQYPLKRSPYNRSGLFRSFRLGGIPVVRISTFSDHHVKYLDGFLRTADELRGEPCVIVDLRGNGGGNTRWPKEWIGRFTGHTPELHQVLSELVSRTALVGQSNYMAWLAAGPGRGIEDYMAGERDRLAARLKNFEKGGARPYWRAPVVPPRPRIPNETTLIVIIDAEVASAGEGFVSYLYGQVDNVVLVGENTRGAVTFGHLTAHRLPNSGLIARLPVKLNVQLDKKMREERGFEPDHWVPARDALNRAVAAVRAGTIPTVKPLQPEVLAAEFVPESPRRFSRAETRRFLQIAVVIISGTLVGFVNRRRGGWIFALLAVGLVVGGLIGFDSNPQARVLALLLGGANAAVAAYKLLQPRRGRAGHDS